MRYRLVPAQWLALLVVCGAGAASVAGAGGAALSWGAWAQAPQGLAQAEGPTVYDTLRCRMVAPGTGCP